MASIKLKLGSLELESEGAEDFLKAEVPNFLKLAIETHGKIMIPAAEPAPNGKPHPHGNGGTTPPNGEGIKGTTETIAARLGVKNSPDLAVAAAARIAFVEGKESFSGGEILSEMRTAKAYFNLNHRKNLMRTLRGLVKDGVFNGISADTFAFSASARDEILGKIRAQA